MPNPKHKNQLLASENPSQQHQLLNLPPLKLKPRPPDTLLPRPLLPPPAPAPAPLPLALLLPALLQGGGSNVSSSAQAAAKACSCCRSIAAASRALSSCLVGTRCRQGRGGGGPSLLVVSTEAPAGSAQWTQHRRNRCRAVSAQHVVLRICSQTYGQAVAESHHMQQGPTHPMSETLTCDCCQGLVQHCLSCQLAAVAGQPFCMCFPGCQQLPPGPHQLLLCNLQQQTATRSSSSSSNSSRSNSNSGAVGRRCCLQLQLVPSRG
jgi:hypothetical protein